MINTLDDYKEAISFELFALESTSKIIEESCTDIIDLRDPAKTILNTAISCNSAEIISEKLNNKISPLLFGASWKILDLSLELTLNNVTNKANYKKWKIEEKKKKAINIEGNIDLTKCPRKIWEHLLKVYIATIEHRHCLIHRTALFDKNTGTLKGNDQKGNYLEPLTLNQQSSIAKAARLLVYCILNRGLDTRQENHLKYQLNQMTPHTHMPIFEVHKPASPVKILISLPEENNILILDKNKILDRARRTIPTANCFNLEIDIPNKPQKKLVACAEDCPIGEIRIDLQSLPEWLKIV